MALSPEQRGFHLPIDPMGFIQDCILMEDLNRLDAPDQPAQREDITTYFADATRFQLPRETMDDMLRFLMRTPAPQIT